MVDPEHAEEALFPERVGDRLRAARIKSGLDLSDIAAKTRVPLRHLSAIEAGDYSSFPSSTYCIGFVKAYARAVGEDEPGLARDLRAELGEVRRDPRTDYYDVEDADPARLPTARLAWTAAVILVVLVAAYWGFRQWQLADPRDAAPPLIEATAPVPTTVPVAPSAPGQVALTAREKVWVRIYDANDQVLLQKEMAVGETFVVPPGANNPQIRTGRPELIAVSIGGREVAPLGAPERMIKDVGISFAALTARAAAGPATGSESPGGAAAAPLNSVPADSGDIQTPSTTP